MISLEIFENVLYIETFYGKLARIYNSFLCLQKGI